uniref:Uncharacterized protein n=1 Tax=Salmo trutta TaxID=8032 RepID=A0A673XCA6_SALTR
MHYTLQYSALHGCVLDFIHLSATDVAEKVESTNLKGCPHTFVYIVYLPTFDSYLSIQFLLGGVEIDKDNNIALLDMEMASMRQGRAFLAHINDNIPKTFSSMEQMVKDLEDKRGPLPLSQPHFESLILGMVYSAHQRYDETGSHEDLHRKGRPRVTSAAENKFNRVTSLRNCSPNKCFTEFK